MAALAGLVPELAVHTNGPEPPDVNATLSPKHSVEVAGVIIIIGFNVIETLATAEVVQAPVPEITVKVVVVAGLTTMVPTAGGVVPLLAAQTNGPAPDAVNVCEVPAQIAVTEGVIVIGGITVTDTAATAVAVQVPVPDNTV